MAFGRQNFPANPRIVLKAPSTPVTSGVATDSLTDSGTERMSLTAVAVYPRGFSPVRQSPSNDTPKQAYDIRVARSVSIQISSYSVTTGATVQLLGSNDSVGYSPIYTFNPVNSTWVNSYAIPTGGTATAPNSTLILLDAPWFAWLQVSVTVADSTGAAYLTVVRRD